MPVRDEDVAVRGDGDIAGLVEAGSQVAVGTRPGSRRNGQRGSIVPYISPPNSPCCQLPAYRSS